ncbi:MAG: response regulator [Betaproteobacteria bacterium]|nr:response regulator [Betaproteobacteria bacterium]
MEQAGNQEDTRFARLAHELRNRIAPIRNAIELMRLRSAAQADIVQLIDLIERQLDGMLLAMADALEAGRPTPQGIASDATPRSGVACDPRRILIADDSVAMRDSLADLLRDKGHDVKAVASGAEALECASAWLPEIVMLDINMPQVDGFEVARRLRARFPRSSMKLVMMSGNTLDRVALSAAARAGFDHCIDKVIDLELLETLLQGR